EGMPIVRGGDQGRSEGVQVLWEGSSITTLVELRRLLAGTLFLLWFYPVPSTAADFSGRVVGITDGDTIKVMHNGRAEKIRLHGIDCPEKGQPFGTKAKEFTSAMVFGKTVTVRVTDTDRYGRTVADVILPDGRVLNRELVAAGLALWYQRYSHDKSLGQVEADGRADRRG